MYNMFMGVYILHVCSVRTAPCPQTASKATATSRMALTVRSGGAEPRAREATCETPPPGASTAVSWRWRGGGGAKESRLDRRHGTSPRGLLPGGHSRRPQLVAESTTVTGVVALREGSAHPAYMTHLGRPPSRTGTPERERSIAPPPSVRTAIELDVAEIVGDTDLRSARRFQCIDCVSSYMYVATVLYVFSDWLVTHLPIFYVFIDYRPGAARDWPIAEPYSCTRSKVRYELVPVGAYDSCALCIVHCACIDH
jgi:hypothetical protein